MPTICTHPAAALALTTYLEERPRASLLVMGGVCTLVPDADVVAFLLGIPYGHPLGHRGFGHSLLFAVLVGGLLSWFWNAAVESRPGSAVLFGYLTVAIASNGLLDAMTNGGEGVGFFIPFDNGRYFLPWRPIHVSPLSTGGFLEHGYSVFLSELKWVWIPALLVAAIGTLVSRFRIQSKSST
jgi:inner membrane protein